MALVALRGHTYHGIGAPADEHGRTHHVRIRTQPISPKLKAQDGDGMLVRPLVFLGKEGPSPEGVDTQNIEEVRPFAVSGFPFPGAAIRRSGFGSPWPLRLRATTVKRESGVRATRPCHLHGEGGTPGPAHRTLPGR